MSNQTEVIQYQTHGTCCQMMQVALQDGKILDAEFFGGCNGNLKGIKNLIKGMTVDEVIERLQGITCGPKSTSCPDQLAKCLIEYKQNQKVAK
ncbi:TIGR03905 family TSCPD domain-containing protein [bacterium]|nr:TIGR03905 family TSCPD domain-containing protein [bacterium]